MRVVGLAIGCVSMRPLRAGCARVNATRALDAVRASVTVNASAYCGPFAIVPNDSTSAAR
jgi:hypothetical protein